MLRSAALRTLLRLKLRGAVRRHLRRLRTPKGAFLTLLGVVIFGLWLTAVGMSFLFRGRSGLAGASGDPEALRGAVRLGCIALSTLSLSSALSHRGLFLPREEIERLFAAPVRRSDLVRYRLVAGLGRSLFGGAILGLFVMPRMPGKLYAFLGVLVGMITLPCLHQLLAILLAALERRLATFLKRIGSFVFLLMTVVCGVLFFMLMVGKGVRGVPILRDLFGGMNAGEPLSHPLLAKLALPFTPWVEAITASSLTSFLPWFGLCVLAGYLLFEITARLPLDYRELSLETSASVAARIRRTRRGGGGASAGRVSRRTLGWRVPWLLGRGPWGAVAWRKLGAIMRKARGTFMISALVLAFLTLLSTTIQGTGEDEIMAPLLIAILGTFYLCAGLRFDFRDELDRMEVIKAWPVPPARLFAAMLLPEVLLVSALLVAAVLLRCAMSGFFHPAVLALCLLQPLFVLAWVAVDNTIFLVMPVRFVPGQEGALQNAGRGLVLVFARLVFLALVVGLGAAGGAAGWFLGKHALGLQGHLVYAPAFTGLWTTTLLVDVLLLRVGGAAFRRFDVARDRG